MLKYFNSPPGKNGSGIWLGFTDDSILRMQGIKLVDGRMPGFAAIVGSTPTNKEAVELVRGLQERNILVFMAGNSGGRAIAEQLAEEGIEMNWDTFLVPYGKEITSAVHALNFAARSAMTFGGISPGGLKEARDILLYNKERVKAFVLALGSDPGVNSGQYLTDEKYATAAGAINFGFPVISDVNIPEILPTGICTFEHVVANVPVADIITRAAEVRGLTIKIEKFRFPCRTAPASRASACARRTCSSSSAANTEAFELLRMKPMDQVEDGKIEVIGPEADQMTEGEAYPLGILAEVAGRKFQEDFESVVERRVHEYLLRQRRLSHGPALDHLGAHQQGSAREGVPDQTSRHDPHCQDSQRLLQHH